ncbi:replicative DNA helicase [Megasphaera butyrica]|uniref:replicative DNA helicase n=1 Tax=Megasphaera butyrica TaxID=2981791 RepID=UPI0008224293|nr:replicative DNA helicase [Megasphaera butyrica]MCU6713910.1 replicative DNA helicase [Megasphaera butyrica]MDN0046863.1 replicative DNA helicase [Megasphaera hexanoica]SCH26147.1 Replicative DNA helicase [uncultured Megasphaera sp.]SCI63600.1 Replicative DNA helicase [uncultured Ruminococcus sp.]
MEQRIPPQNVEAEQAVLGAMMLEHNAVVAAMEKLRPGDFYREVHRTIFEAMEHLHHDNKEVDVITLPEELRRMKKLDDVGGLEYILSLPNLVATAANIEYHANIVAEKALARNIITTCTELTSEAYDGEKEPEDLLDDAERRILQISESKRRGDFAPVGVVVEETLDKITKLYENKAGITGLPTGFRDLDRLTSGLQPSDLILVAARPSMGKTAFTLNIAQNVGVKQHKTVAFFSLEMSQEQLVQRLLCQIAHIDSQKLRTGQLNSDDEWTKLTDACDKLYQAPIYIDDTPGISVTEMRSKARRLKAEHGLDLIIVDYLQLMQGRSSESRQQEISEISRSLKALARELKVPLIALSQLSRSVESRQDKRPMLSDLRESGALEQDADIVSFLYREDYYDKETENQHITEIILAKHRNGPVGSVKLYFKGEYTLFLNLDTTHEDRL